MKFQYTGGMRRPGFKRGMVERRLNAVRRRKGLRPMPISPRTYINVAGTVGVPMRAYYGAPRFVMPYGAPGLGELWDDHLQGLEGFNLKKIGKGLKKIVKSKLFKYAAIGTAAYFAAPALAAQMGAGGLGRKQAVKFLGGKALSLLKKKKKIAVPLLGTGLLASVVGAQPGSAAAASMTPGGVPEGASFLNPAGTIPGEYGFTPEHPEDYQFSAQPPDSTTPYGPTYDTTATSPDGTARPRHPQTQQAGILGGMNVNNMLVAGLVVGAGYLAYQAMSRKPSRRRR